MSVLSTVSQIHRLCEQYRLTKRSVDVCLCHPVIHHHERKELNIDEPPLPVKVEAGSKQTWYTSYLVGKDVLYMSDVAGIPEDKVETLTNLSPKVLIIDCIDTRCHAPHVAHFTIVEALMWARVINPKRTYLTGISHNTAHQTYQWLLDLSPEAGDEPSKAAEKYRKHNSDFAEWNTEYISNLKQTKEKVKKILTANLEGKDPMVVKPAYDGLCIVVGDDGEVHDDDD